MSGVSFLITTLNNGRTLTHCLQSLASQKYSRSQFEILILDGGSTDSTIKIAENFHKNYHLPIKTISAGLRDNQEARRLIGFKKAKFDLVCILDADNYLDSPDWIKRMVEPLDKYPHIVGSFTLHFAYDPRQSLFNRYLALFGNNDPVVYYLHKTDRLKWTDKSWPRSHQIVSRHSHYTLLKFNQFNFPTLGSNGTIIRKNLIDYQHLQPQQFFHTDILYDLLVKGRDTYAVVDVPLTHDTSSSVFSHLQKRIKYMYLHHLELWPLRRYKIFNPSFGSDWLHLLLYIFFTITAIPLLIEALMGYRRQKDTAWFLHPFICWMFLLGYTSAVLKKIWTS